MDHVQPVRHGQMEGFDHLHVEAAKKPLRTNSATMATIITLVTGSSRSLDAFTDQDPQRQTRYGVTHNQLRGAAENRRPEA